MNYLAFYRKYRPSKFSEVVGQEHIVKILQQAIINNKISHAYLFYGPRGTGKTSIAKIFAKNVNCTSPIDGDRCEHCDICKKIKDNDIDIIEIDAASNNGVEEIREIRNNVKLVPTVGKYKVYIIDEVHMLSIGAFNALLKTLEEPPEHVIFILATTEIQKIPLTIISRCQRFDFKKINNTKMVELLQKITKSEKKKISDECLELISDLSDGCVRDAVNLLDQLLASSINITADDIYKLSGVTSRKVIEQMFDYILNVDIENSLKLINNLSEEGKNFTIISSDILTVSRNVMIFNNVKNYFSETEEKRLEKYRGVPNSATMKISTYFINIIEELKKTNNQKLLFEIKTFELIEKLLLEKQEEIISREIISNKETLKESEKILKEEENDKIISREIILTRVNNTLAEAKKENRIEFMSKMVNYENYISNKKYNIVSNLLIKGKVVACSETNVLFTYEDITNVDNFYLNLEEIEKFIKSVHEKEIKPIAVSEKEWISIKNKYMQDTNNGKKYITQEEKVIKHSKNNLKNSKANDIFGEENINIQ